VTQDNAKGNRIGSRVCLHLDGDERTTCILLSTAEIGVVIREDAKPGVVVLPWRAEGTSRPLLRHHCRLPQLAVPLGW
jgi:hypothetical protein